MGVLNFEGRSYPYTWWNGQQLKGTLECPLAFDTETQAIPPYREPQEGEDPLSLPPSPIIVPQVATGLAYDGNTLVLIHPTKLKDFVSKHKTHQMVGHNFPFDFWVLMKHARDTKNALLEEWLWQMGDANKYCDTAILDLLLQLGTGRYRMGKGKGKSGGGDDKKLLMTNLGELASEWQCGELDKEDPYRLRFGEWIGLSESEIEALPEFDAFCNYALKDVVVTWLIYPKQREQAVALMRRAGWNENPNQKTYEMRPDALKQFGPLSEFVQVKGAIALDQLSRTPVYINQTKRAELEQATRDRYQLCMDTLMELEPTLFKRYAATDRKGRGGQIRYNRKTRLPEMSSLVLEKRLQQEAVTLNIDPPISKGKNKAISKSTKDWAHMKDQSPFLTAWCGLGAEVKLLSFYLSLDSPDGKAYSRYNLLMRTGRTSAQAYRLVKGKVTLVPSFNIQQMPRPDEKHPERDVRALFHPPDGHMWFGADYGYIELCALAATCKSRFGWSKLADVIVEHRTKGGLDPHEKMAVMMLGCDERQYQLMDKAKRKSARQAAKAVNFGRPGGLGDETFCAYAKVQYQTVFTKKEAKEAKLKWMELYPEMKEYLTDPTELAMRWQSDRSSGLKLSYLQRRRLSDYLKMTEKERQAQNYSESELEMFWDVLGWIASKKNDPELSADIDDRQVTGRVRNLVTYRACTLTGRVRNNVTFTAGANTPFQSAAADGAKLCLWNLMRRGIHLLGFIHDSVECAIPKGKERSLVPIIEKVMVQSMEFVLGNGVPVAVDGNLSTGWAKG